MTILYLILFIYAQLIFFKKTRFSQFNCGITGFCGEGPANQAKLRLLAVLNEERGKHSSGINMSDGVSIKTAGFHDGQFRDGFKHKPLTALTGGPVLVHTRQATVGDHTEANAHPFKYKLATDKEAFVFTHNGTVSNWKDLCKEYNTDSTQFTVDSKALGYLVYKYGFEVLSKYEGSAAAAFKYLNNNNTLFLWNGATKTTKNGAFIYDRSLFYYYDKEDRGYYYSSDKDHLVHAANGDKALIEAVPTNTVIRITNGKITKKYPIDRSHIFDPPYNNTYYDNYSRYNTVDDDEEVKEKRAIFFVVNELVYSKGRLYQVINSTGTLADLTGTFYISNKSKQVLSSKDAKITKHSVYYIYKGIQLKNAGALAEFKRMKYNIDFNKAVFNHLIHKDFLLLSNGYYWKENSLVSDTIQPDFSVYKFEINFGKLVSQTRPAPLAMSPKQKTKGPSLKSDPALEYFNTLFATEYPSRIEAEEWWKDFVKTTDEYDFDGYYKQFLEDTLDSDIVAADNKDLASITRTEEHIFDNDAGDILDTELINDFVKDFKVLKDNIEALYWDANLINSSIVENSELDKDIAKLEMVYNLVETPAFYETIAENQEIMQKLLNKYY